MFRQFILRLLYHKKKVLVVVFSLLTLTAQAALCATPEEIASLMSLYNNLGGPGWRDNANWGTGDPCTNDWYGVECDSEDTHVVRVNLDYNNLIGDIAGAVFTGLEALTHLVLSRNEVEGDIYDLDLSDNTALEFLVLDSTEIGGDIDDLDLSSNTNLRTINLGWCNNIAGDIANLDLSNNTALVYLSLSRNKIGGDIDGLDISNNPRLRLLDFESNQIGGDIDGFNISNSTGLEWIDITFNQIGGDIAGLDISNNPHLQKLHLDHNQIEGNIAGLDISKNTLTELNIPYNQIGGNIEDLKVASNTILERLDLSNNVIEGDIAKLNLSNNTALNIIALNGNLLDGTVPDMMATSLEKCYLCGGANIIRPSGDPDINSFAEEKDETGWSAADGCGSLPPTPCAGICENPITIEWTGSYQSGSLGVEPTCFETTQPISDGNCGNFAEGKTLSINGTEMTCNNQPWASIPDPRSGGYCITTTKGDWPWAFFTLW